MGKLVGLAFLAAVGGVVYMILPDLKRYLKMTKM